MFRLKEVSKIYKSKKTSKAALDGVSVTLPEKGLVFVIGKSGSGKSTFLNLVSGLDKPTVGDICYGDSDYKTLRGWDFDYLHHQEFGFVFQDYCLIEEVSVEDNIALGALENRKKVQRQIDGLLKEVFLEGYNKKLVKELSGGEKQRVAIARALIKKPRVVFCDEPTGNLDRLSSVRIFSALKKYSKEALVIVVTHDKEAAYVFGDRIIELGKGKIRSDKVLDENRVEQGKYVISSNLYTSSGELAHVNSLLEEGKIDGIASRFSKFVDNKEEQISIPPQEKQKKKRAHCQGPLFRIFNAKPAKTILFSFFTGIILGLLTTCVSLNQFSSTEYLWKHPELYDSGLVLRRLPQKATETSYYNSLFPLRDRDLSLLEERVPGSYYLLYRTPAKFRGTTGEDSVTGFGTNLKSFSSFFTSQIDGTLVTEKEFLTGKLGQGELSILESDACTSDGVYLTDYLCDSYNYWSNTSLAYKDFLGQSLRLAPGYRCSAFRINGVIQTDYHERCKSLIDFVSQSNGTPDANDLGDYSDELDYLRDYLSIAYSFNPDFQQEILKDSSAQPMLGLTEAKAVASDGSNACTFYSPTYISSDPSLDDETFLVDSWAFKYNNPTSETSDQINQRLASLGKVRITSTLPSHVGEYGERLLDGDFYLKVTSRQMTCNYAVSPNVFAKLKEKYLYPAKVYLKDSCDRSVLTSIVSDSDFILNSFFFETLTRVNGSIVKVTPIFRLLSSVSLIAALLIVIYYAYSSISSERYNIGVLKSLGVQNSQIGLGFLIKSSLFAALCVSFYGIAYWIMSLFTNDVMKALLATRLFNYSTSISITISFNGWHYLLYSAYFLLSVLALTSLLLLKLVRIKPVTIIKNKD